MFKTLLALIVSSLLAFSCSSASAQTFRTFFLVSKATGKCVSLKAADQADGGGLVMKDCQVFPDYFVTAATVGGGSQQAVLQFHLTTTKWMCFSTTDTPTINPGGGAAKVTSRNCSGMPGGSGIWNIRGTDANGFGQIEKMSQGAVNPTNFCLRENAQTSELELPICQGGDDELWQMKSIVIQ